MGKVHERERTPNPRLRRQRELRGWSQGHVAKALQALFPGIAVTAKDVGRWESGKRRPGPYYREKLCVLFQTTADKLGFIPQDVYFEQNGEEGETAQEGEHSSLWTVPSRRNPFFTGRDQLIQAIHERFVAPVIPSLAQIQALCGLGGIGKTQIALEYAHRYRDAYQFVLWVKATRSTLLSDFVTLVDLLNLPEKEQKDQSILVASIKRWLVSHDRWLLIFDNVDEIEPVYDLLPAELKGHVLLTTRIYALGTFAHRVDVEKMNAEEGALLLLRRAKIADVSSYDQINTEEMTNAKVLVDLLDGLPLALDQAGAYIEETACTVSHYVRAYRSHQPFLLNRRGSPALDHPDSVVTTFSLSFEQVQQVSPLAAELLQAFAFLAPDAIPDELLFNGAKELALSQDIVSDPLLFDEAIAILRRFSLIRRNRDNHTITIHRLVQIVLKEMMSEAERYQWAARIIRAVNHVLPDFQHSENVQYQRYLLHAQACLGFIQQWNMTFIEAASLLSQTGLYLKVSGAYTEARTAYERCRDMLQSQENSSPLLSTLLHLGDLEYVRGELSTAMQTLRNTLSLSETLHLQLIIGQSHRLIGHVLYIQEKYHEALDHYHKALDIFTDLDNQAYLSRVYMNLAETYAPISLDKALSFAEAAIKLDTQLDFTLELGKALFTRADIARMQKRFTDCARDVRASIEQFLKVGHISGLVRAYRVEALMYLDQKQFEKAQRALDQSDDRLAKIRVYPALALKNMITRLEIYRAMGAIHQAQEIHSRLTEMRKSSELGYLVDEYISSSPLLCPSGENA